VVTCRPNDYIICGCQPWAEEGLALLEKAAGQGHAYAMHALGCIYHETQEYVLTVEWFTKGAEAGLPKAKFNLGRGLHSLTSQLNLRTFGTHRSHQSST
jgi:TPR repeat protein